MKKIIALVLLLVLAVGVFTACNQTQPTEKKVRWSNNETWTYDISLMDLESSYSTTKGTYYRDFLATNETNPLGNQPDRLVPQELDGQYIVTLSVDVASNLATVSTTQTMLATYTKQNIGDLQLFEALIVAEDSATVTLKSTTKTSVVFKNTTMQTPVSSTTTVDGFYIGKQNQSLSKYSIKTEYEINTKKTVIKVTQDDKTTQTEMNGTNIIDSNQVLWFARSFDKTATSFQDMPQVMVFDALANTARKLTFTYTQSQNVLVNHTFAGTSSSKQVATALNRLDIALDSTPYMTQVNLPDLTAKNLDRISSAEALNTYFPKHSIYRFRVGFVTYELSDYITDSMVKAVEVPEA